MSEQLNRVGLIDDARKSLTAMLEVTREPGVRRRITDTLGDLVYS